jgi:hypothetical protein
VGGGDHGGHGNRCDQRWRSCDDHGWQRQWCRWWGRQHRSIFTGKAGSKKNEMGVQEQ